MASNYTNPINILDSNNATGLGSGGSLNVEGGASIKQDTFIGGNVSISGTTTSFSDNILLINKNPTQSTDTGIIFQRYTSDIQNNDNYAGIIYSEQNDAFNLGYLVSDADRNYVSIGNLVSLNTKEITTGNINFTGNLYKNGTLYNPGSQWTTTNSDISYTSGNVITSNLITTNISGSNLRLSGDSYIDGNVNFNGNLYKNGSLYNPGSQWTTLNSDIFYTSGNVITSNLITTNISGSNLRLSGDLYIDGTLSVVNVTTTNVVDINISTGTITVSGTSTLTNVIATNFNLTSTEIALGNGAGLGQISGEYAISIGNAAGNTSQGSQAVAIGRQAGQTNQGGSTVAIGLNAGQNSQGSYAIAIGNAAGQTNQHTNSIILNASSTSLNSGTAGAFYVNPVRNLSQTNVLGYDTAAKEVTYFPLSSTYQLTQINQDSFSYDYALRIDGTGSESIRSITTDFSNNFYVTGYSNSTRANFYAKDGTTVLSTLGNLNTNYSSFTAKYTNSGVLSYILRIDGLGNDYAQSIISDRENNFYVTGYSNSTRANFYATNGTTVLATLGNLNTSNAAFIAKYTSIGDLSHLLRIDGSSNDLTMSMATDTENNMYVMGHGSATINFYATNSNTVQATMASLNTNAACFITKYNSYGALSHILRIDGSGIETATSITTDIANNIYATGYSNSSQANFYATDGSTVVATLGNLVSGVDSGFIVKYNQLGELNYTLRIDGTGSDYPLQIATDLSNSAYVTGYYSSTQANFYATDGSTILTTLGNLGNNAGFIAKYTSLGELNYVLRIDNVGNDFSRSVTTDTFDNIYITGSNSSTQSNFYATDGSTILATMGNINTANAGFVAKYKTSGELSYVLRIDGTGNDTPQCLVTDSLGAIYVGGSSNSTQANLYSIDDSVLATMGNFNTNSSGFVVKYNNIINSVFYTGGNVGINTTNPAYTLDVNGTVDAISITTASLYSRDIITTNISSGILIASTGITTASLQATNVNATNSTITNVIATNSSTDVLVASTGITTGTIYASGTSTLQNVIGTNFSASTLIATTSITSELLSATNIVGNSISAGTLSATTITGANLSLSGNLNVNGAFKVPVDNTNNANNTVINNNGVSVISYETGWAASVDGTNIERAETVTVDASGNVYLGGYYTTTSPTVYNAGNVSSGLTLRATSGLSAGYVVKYNSSGVAQWAASIDGASSDAGNSVAVDASGNVYLGGYYTTNTPTVYNAGNVSSGLTLRTTSGVTASYVVKYNASGVAQWAASVDGSGNEHVKSVAVDASGNVYLCGYYFNSSTIVYNAGNVSSGLTLRTTSGLSAGYVVKYNSSGVAQWAASVDGTSSDEGNSVAVDVSGNVYLSGYYTTNSPTVYNAGNVSSGLTLRTTSGLSAGYVVKYNSSGVAQWTASVDGTGSEYGQSVAVDASGNVYLGGYYASSPTVYNAGNVSSDLTLRATSGLTASYVVKYTASGVAQWAASVDGTSSEYGQSVAVDASGNVYLGGYYANSPTVYNPGNVSSGLILRTPDSSAGYVVKYNTADVHYKLLNNLTASDSGVCKHIVNTTSQPISIDIRDAADTVTLKPYTIDTMASRTFVWINDTWY
jgi:hypothetical protein